MMLCKKSTFGFEDWSYWVQRSEGLISLAERAKMEEATWLVESHAAVRFRCLRKVLDIKSGPSAIVCIPADAGCGMLQSARCSSRFDCRQLSRLKNKSSVAVSCIARSVLRLVYGYIARMLDERRRRVENEIDKSKMKAL